MSRNHITIDAPPECVYEVLTDAEAYGDWVVGAKQIRGVDRRWPHRGAAFHHRVGAGPFELRDESKILEAKENRRLVLEVRVQPLGEAHVIVDLRPRSRGRRTRVTLTEYPTAGPARHALGLPLQAATHARNAWSLRRLRRIAERRWAESRRSRGRRSKKSRRARLSGSHRG